MHKTDIFPFRPTVLVVDDTPLNLVLMRDLLEDQYAIKVASNGERGLKIANSAIPDLILLDITMPDMDGYQVCRELKANPLTADIPVIFLTARTETDDEQRGFELGAADYITKPISPAIVLARVKAHVQLKQARDALLTRNKEDTQRFESALAQQLELNALKSTFVSMTSHEFRTPLTSILVSQSMLRNHCDRIPAKERNDILDGIESSVNRMVSLLEKVLTIGRADANLLDCKPKPVDLHKSCTQLIDEAIIGHCGPDRQHTGRVALHFEPGGEPLNLDEKLLRHILGNLLSNAIKYSPESAQVHLRVRNDGKSLVFEVQDQGIGIPQEDLPRLFGNFHRAGNVGDIPGTGLGLAIVKRAVETHGGTIEVSSQADRGTCFIVTIPLP